MDAFLQIEYDRFSYSFKSFDCLNTYPFRYLKPVKPPKWFPTLKWSQNRPRNDAHFSSRRPRNDPQLILGMQWYTRTMDRAKYTTLIKALLIILTRSHSLMKLIWNYTLNWIKRKYYLIHKLKSSIFLARIFSNTMNCIWWHQEIKNIPMHNILKHNYLSHYSAGHRENWRDVKF